MNKKNPFSHHPGYNAFGATAKEQSPQGEQHDEQNAYHHNAEEAINSAESGEDAQLNQLKDLFPDDLLHEEALGGEAHEPILSTVSEHELEAECRKRICPNCPVKKELDDNQLRALADLENTKKRLARERDDMKRFATEGVLNDIIPALDNLDLALLHAPKDDVAKNFIMGVGMTKNLLLDALKKHGLEEIGMLGQAFDPAIHEAVGVADNPEIPVDHVCALLSKGYSLQGRLLRPARVTVCKR